MARILLCIAVVMTVVLSWGWLGPWLTPHQRASIETDGSVVVDPAFDGELNALAKEMLSADADFEKELQALEQEQ